MFSDEGQKNNPQAEKDINLLPEDLRRLQKKGLLNKLPNERVRYTRPGELLSEPELEGGKISWLDKVKLLLSRRAPLLADNAKESSKQIASPARPLSKLYAQQTIIHPAKQAPNRPEIKPEAVKQPAAPDITPPVINIDDIDEAEVKPAPPSVSRVERDQDQQVPADAPEQEVKVSDWRTASSDPSSILAKIDSQLSKGKKDIESEQPQKDQFDVNLIPEELVAEVDTKKIIRALILASVLGILCTAAAYLGTDLYRLRQQRNVQGVQEEIDKVNQSINGKSDDLKILLRYKQIYENVGQLLDAHLYWSNFFDFLEQTVVADVYYDNIDADINGLVTINARAKSYTAIAQQYKALEEAPEVITVNIDRAFVDVEEQNKHLEEVFMKLLGEGKAVQEDESASTTLLTFEEQNEIILNTIRNTPITFSIRLIINPNIYSLNNEGKSTL